MELVIYRSSSPRQHLNPCFNFQDPSVKGVRVGLSLFHVSVSLSKNDEIFIERGTSLSFNTDGVLFLNTSILVTWV